MDKCTKCAQKQEREESISYETTIKKYIRHKETKFKEFLAKELLERQEKQNTIGGDSSIDDNKDEHDVQRLNSKIEYEITKLEKIHNCLIKARNNNNNNTFNNSNDNNDTNDLNMTWRENFKANQNNHDDFIKYVRNYSYTINGNDEENTATNIKPRILTHQMQSEILNANGGSEQCHCKRHQTESDGRRPANRLSGTMATNKIDRSTGGCTFGHCATTTTSVYQCDYGSNVPSYCNYGQLSCRRMCQHYGNENFNTVATSNAVIGNQCTCHNYCYQMPNNCQCQLPMPQMISSISNNIQSANSNPCSHTKSYCCAAKHYKRSTDLNAEEFCRNRCADSFKGSRVNKTGGERIQKSLQGTGLSDLGSLHKYRVQSKEKYIKLTLKKDAAERKHSEKSRTPVRRSNQLNDRQSNTEGSDISSKSDKDRPTSHSGSKQKDAMQAKMSIYKYRRPVQPQPDTSDVSGSEKEKREKYQQYLRKYKEENERVKTTKNVSQNDPEIPTVKDDKINKARSNETFFKITHGGVDKKKKQVTKKRQEQSATTTELSGRRVTQMQRATDSSRQQTADETPPPAADETLQPAADETLQPAADETPPPAADEIPPPAADETPPLAADETSSPAANEGPPIEVVPSQAEADKSIAYDDDALPQKPAQIPDHQAEHENVERSESPRQQRAALSSEQSQETARTQQQAAYDEIRRDQELSAITDRERGQLPATDVPNQQQRTALTNGQLEQTNRQQTRYDAIGIEQRRQQMPPKYVEIQIATRQNLRQEAAVKVTQINSRPDERTAKSQAEYDKSKREELLRMQYDPQTRSARPPQMNKEYERQQRTYRRAVPSYPAHGPCAADRHLNSIYGEYEAPCALMQSEYARCIRETAPSTTCNRRYATDEAAAFKHYAPHDRYAEQWQPTSCYDNRDQQQPERQRYLTQPRYVYQEYRPRYADEQIGGAYRIYPSAEYYGHHYYDLNYPRPRVELQEQCDSITSISRVYRRRMKRPPILKQESQKTHTIMTVAPNARQIQGHSVEFNLQPNVEIQIAPASDGSGYSETVFRNSPKSHNHIHTSQADSSINLASNQNLQQEIGNKVAHNYGDQEAEFRILPQSSHHTHTSHGDPSVNPVLNRNPQQEIRNKVVHNNGDQEAEFRNLPQSSHHTSTNQDDFSANPALNPNSQQEIRNKVGHNNGNEEAEFRNLPQSSHHTHKIEVNLSANPVSNQTRQQETGNNVAHNYGDQEVEFRNVPRSSHYIHTKRAYTSSSIVNKNQSKQEIGNNIEYNYVEPTNAQLTQCRPYRTSTIENYSSAYDTAVSTTSLPEQIATKLTAQHQACYNKCKRSVTYEDSEHTTSGTDRTAIDWEQVRRGHGNPRTNVKYNDYMSDYPDLTDENDDDNYTLANSSCVTVNSYPESNYEDDYMTCDESQSNQFGYFPEFTGCPCMYNTYLHMAEACMPPRRYFSN